MNKKISILAIVIIFAVSFVLTSCGTKKTTTAEGTVTVEFGAGYDAKTGKFKAQYINIPADQDIYAVLKSNKPFNAKNAEVSIYEKHGQSESAAGGASLIISPEDKNIAYPIKIKTPGTYRLEFLADKKVIMQKEVNVVAK